MCKHFIGGWSCSAFDVIPIEILRGELNHSTKIDGQEGDIVFEEIENYYK